MVSFPDAASLIVLILDLVEGIITTIHFDEDVHGMFFLALFWIGYGIADAVFQEITANTKCKWDDCLFKCGAEVGQCVLYIHFCRKDAGVDVPLQVLAAIQLFLVCSGTIVWEWTNRPKRGRDKSFVGGDVENADQAGTIVGVVGEHNELASESQVNVKEPGEGDAERDTGRVSRKSATAERAQVMREMNIVQRGLSSPWLNICVDLIGAVLNTLLPLLYNQSPHTAKSGMNF